MYIITYIYDLYKEKAASLSTQIRLSDTLRDVLLVGECSLTTAFQCHPGVQANAATILCGYLWCYFYLTPYYELVHS